MKKISIILVDLIMIVFSACSFIAAATKEEGERALKKITEEGSSPKTTTSSPYQKSWAIAIGIDRYANPKIPLLDYAVNDAQSIVAVLTNLGFPKEQIFLLFNEQATRHAIEEVLYNRLREAGKEDRLFVFFAGHGATEQLPREGSEGFLLPYDADPSSLFTTAISMSDVKRIGQRIAAKHILFAVDACYSGFSITRSVAPKVVDEEYLRLVTQDPAVQVITAGKAGEQVREENGHGVFTNQLLKALQGFADEDRNGLITGIELASFLQSRVIRDTEGGQHPQFGQLSGEGQFVFVLPKGDSPASTTNPDSKAEKQAGEQKQPVKQKPVEEPRELKQEPQNFIPPKSKLEVVSIPLDADIFLNDRYVGKTVTTLELEAGEYTIRIKKLGYRDYEKKIKINPGQTERISAALEDLRRRH
jgi:uncharacterized caspase-like protein